MKNLPIHASSILLAALSFLTHQFAFALNSHFTYFPVEHYSQSIHDYLPSSDPNYDTPLLSRKTQQQYYQLFLESYFSCDTNGHSPWSQSYVTTILDQAPSLHQHQIHMLQRRTNHHKDKRHQGYRLNYHPITNTWLTNIKNNMNLNHVKQHQYSPSNRAISIRNLNLRELPTHEPHFYHPNLQGQGFPFDNIQESSIWAGTPLYVVSYTKNKAWALVIAPGLTGWVPTNGIGHVSPAFISKWVQQAHHRLGAVTQSGINLLNHKDHFLFTSYVGSVFPIVDQDDHHTTLMVPILDEHQQAIIQQAVITNNKITKMPLTFTKHHFAKVLSTLIGRAYGWGGLYNYNDCSQELKSLFTPFGIFLPRHSENQILAGQIKDLSNLSPEKRIAYLKQYGHPLLTLIHIDNHIMLYLGNYPLPNDPNTRVPYVYQNTWSMKTKNRGYRELVGKSIILPLLVSYNDAPNTKSKAADKLFQISDLAHGQFSSSINNVSFQQLLNRIRNRDSI